MTKRINLQRHAPRTPVWQQNYYEHIIRNELALACIQNYIHNNPATWYQDSLNPALYPIPSAGLTTASEAHSLIIRKGSIADIPALSDCSAFGERPMVAQMTAPSAEAMGSRIYEFSDSAASADGRVSR